MRKRIRTRTAALLTALLLVVTAGVVGFTATAASASLPSPSCFSGGVGTGTIVGCLFTDSNGNGSVWHVNRSQGCKNLPAVLPPNSGNWNDAISSWQNHAGSTYKIQAWENANCNGSSISLLPGHSETLSWIWNDEISSYAVYPGY